MEPEVPPGGEEGAVEEQPERRPLDPETAARREAALEHVVRYGDPILRERAREVEAFDAALRADVERMVKLMDDALGVGLAATQIGILRRVLVYRLPEGEARAVVNPVIAETSDERAPFFEGCLSLPGVWVDVERPARVVVRGFDEHGEAIEIAGEGLEASVLQHEVDHLDGVLILDRLPREARKEAMRALRAALEGERSG